MDKINPDQIVYWSLGGFSINATIIFSWFIMILLLVLSWLVTRKLTSKIPMSRGQNLLEVIVSTIRKQIADISQDGPDKYLPFVGSLFLFIAVSNTLSILPTIEQPGELASSPLGTKILNLALGYRSPTGSLTTTVALSLCVFFGVPYFGIKQKGLVGYFKEYIKPSPIMLPFNIIGEFSRTLALAVRLFGNVMSGTLIIAMLVSFVPLIFPVIMHAFEMVIGWIQAYIFAVLAMESWKETLMNTLAG